MFRIKPSLNKHLDLPCILRINPLYFVLIFVILLLCNPMARSETKENSVLIGRIEEAERDFHDAIDDLLDEKNVNSGY